MEGNRLVKRYKISVNAYNFSDHYGTHVDMQDTAPSEQDIINSILKSKETLKWGSREALVEEVYVLIKEKE
jgi:hypothetical protein